MKAAFVATVLALTAAGLAFAFIGIRPFRAPHDPVRVEPGARDYWVEIRNGAGLLRHKWGGSWPIPPLQGLPYGGEAGVLSLLDLHGLDRRMLVLRILLGAGMRRQAAWEVSAFGELRPVADGLSIGDVPETIFEDADGDGREEFAVFHRRLPARGEYPTPEDWIVHTTYHAWTGARFEPRWKRLQALGTLGPLVDLANPRESGSTMDPER